MARWAIMFETACRLWDMVDMVASDLRLCALRKGVCCHLLLTPTLQTLNPHCRWSDVYDMVASDLRLRALGRDVGETVFDEYVKELQVCS